VSSALRVTLLDKRRPPTTSGGSTSEAYNLYLQARYFRGRNTKQDLENAIRYYERALQLDPGYALAWVGLSTAHGAQGVSGYVPVDEGFRKSRREAEKALALDPNLAEAHAALGQVRSFYDWDWSGADVAHKEALRLDPGNAMVVRTAGVLSAILGRFDEAIELDRRAVGLDPLSMRTHLNLGFHAWRAGRLDEAEAAFRKALELNSEYPGAHMQLGRVLLIRPKPDAALQEMDREGEPPWRRQGRALAYHALGRKGEADAALAELLEKDKENAAFQIAEVYAFRGEPDRAFTWLERAYAQRDTGLSEMKGDPLLKNLEADPRYAAFLGKMRLPL
jgi:tetratricopeptide (TPR) repeat protein